MTVMAMQKKINEIVADPTMSVSHKIEELQALDEEARALQRAATESTMDDDDGLQNNLRLIEKALLDLGVDNQEKGPATL